MKPKIFNLENGMKVVLEENHSSPVVSLQALVTVGSADETDDVAGICHLIEHMLFKGTKKRKLGDIARDVEAAGGDINAYTSFDQTVYYIHMASRFQNKGLDILADAIQNPTFDREELEKEKEVILEEIRRERDNPGRYVGELLFQKAYETHTYRRPIIGFEKVVKSVSQETLFHFFHNWYIPENVTFIAVGDFQTEMMLAKIKEAFVHFLNPNWERPTTPRKKEPPQKNPKFNFLADNIQSIHSILGFHIPEIIHPDIPALDILTHILGGLQSSRLEQTLKEKKRLVQSVHAYAYAPKDPGLLIVGMHLNTAQAAKAFEVFWEEIEKFKIEGPTEEELKRAKLNIRASETYEKETVGGQAGKYAYFLSTAGSLEFEKEYFQKIQSTTAEEIIDAARRYLHPQNLTAALMVPQKEFQPEWKSQIEEILSKSQPPQTIKPLAKLATTTLKTSKPKKVLLSNGIRCILKEDHKLPILSISLMALGGLRVENPKINGVYSLLSQMITKGTKKKSALEVAQAIESMAGTLEGFSGRNSYGLRMEFLSEYFEKGVDLFSEVLLEPTWDKKELEKEKKLDLEAIKNQEDNLSQLAFHHFQKALFPNHPYGMRSIGSKESIPTITAKLLQEFHHKTLMGKNIVVSAVGDFCSKSLCDLLEKKLGGLPKKEARFVTPPSDPKPATIQEIVVHKDKEQAHIVLGFQSNKLLSPDHYPMALLNQILSGMGGRLFLELRDKQSLAYAVTSVHMEGIDPGYFAVYIGTDPSKIDQAIAGIKEELQKISEETVSEDELDRIKNYLVGTYELSLQKCSSLAQAYVSNEIYGLGYEEVERYPSKILKITKEEILKAAKKTIDLNAFILSIIKPN